MAQTIRYDGPVDAVDVPLPSGIVVTVARGETARFPDALAERLLEQDVWSRPSDPLPDHLAPPPAPARSGRSRPAIDDTSGDAPQED